MSNDTKIRRKIARQQELSTGIVRRAATFTDRRKEASRNACREKAKYRGEDR